MEKFKECWRGVSGSEGELGTPGLWVGQRGKGIAREGKVRVRRGLGKIWGGD